MLPLLAIFTRTKRFSTGTIAGNRHYRGTLLSPCRSTRYHLSVLLARLHDPLRRQQQLARELHPLLLIQ